MRTMPWLAGFVLVFLGAGALAAGPGLASSPLSWSSPMLIDSSPPQPELDAVSCPSVSLCVAVDRFGGIVSSTDPTGEGEGAGTWSFAQVGTKTYLGNTPCYAIGLCLLGVSCPSRTLCVAVGESGQAVVSSDPAGGAGAWTQSDVDGSHALFGISCPSIELCVAVDSAGDVLTSTDPTGGAQAWSATHLVEHVLRAISCPSMSLCVAVDEAGDVVSAVDPTGGVGAWSVSDVDGGTPLLGVSCTEDGGSLCVADGGGGEVVTSTEPALGAWKATSEVEGTSTAIGGVSCPSVSLCVAIDGAGNILSTTNPTGGAGAWTPTHVDGEEFLLDVSCASTVLCVAVNGHGDVLSSSDPVGEAWDRTHVDSNNPPTLYNVSCPAVSLCVAADNAKNILTTTDPGGGTWSASQLFTSMWGVSCASVSLCIAGNGGDILTSVEPASGASAWQATDEYVSPSWPLPPHFAAHFRASCPSSSLCIVVDAYGEILRSTDPTTPPAPGEPTWMAASETSVFPPYEGPHEAENVIDPVFGVSCPSTSLCAAVDSHGYVSVTTDPANRKQPWVPTRIDGGTPFEDISCPSVSLCVAVDAEGNVLSSTDPAGGAGAWSLAGVDVGHAITAVACPSVSLCVAVDEAGDVLSTTDPTGDAGAWSLSSVDPGHALTPLHALTSVSCASVSLCVAVDRAGYDIVGRAPEEPGHKEGQGQSTPAEPSPGGSGSGAPGSKAPSEEKPSNRFTILRVRVRSKGRIELRLRAPDAGSFRASAVAVLSAKTARRLDKAKKHAARGPLQHEIPYGTASAVTRAQGTTTLLITPRRLALSALRSRLRPLVTITFTPRGGQPSSQSVALTSSAPLG
jgi:hypothetical protein